jgi:hypothetical protein
MIWKHGTNENQEYFHILDCPELCVARNMEEQHWAIYDLRGIGIKMVPNPKGGYSFATCPEATAFAEKYYLAVTD